MTFFKAVLTFAARLALAVAQDVDATVPLAPIYVMSWYRHWCIARLSSSEAHANENNEQGRARWALGIFLHNRGLGRFWPD
jgi:hypothetical protein